jgi:hypothetical protein
MKNAHQQRQQPLAESRTLHASLAATEQKKLSRRRRVVDVWKTGRNGSPIGDVYAHGRCCGAENELTGVIDRIFTGSSSVTRGFTVQLIPTLSYAPARGFPPR